LPGINALSEYEHPCQALADLLTVREKKGGLRGVTLAFVGDGNNVARSLCLGAAMRGMHFRIASPGGASRGSVALSREPRQAVGGSGVVYTDVWERSTGQEQEDEGLLAAAGGG